MKLQIKDREGVISIAEMRHYFEKAIKDTPKLSSTPIGTMEINGQFSHYMSADTDTLWIGFALGMRCAERKRNAEIARDLAEAKRVLGAAQHIPDNP